MRKVMILTLAQIQRLYGFYFTCDLIKPLFRRDYVLLSLEVRRAYTHYAGNQNDVNWHFDQKH